VGIESLITPIDHAKVLANCFKRCFLKVGAVNELDELKKKRRRFETDVDGLVKSADEFAQKAEDTGKLVWITKSNTAKEKEMTCKDIEDKIGNVVE